MSALPSALVGRIRGGRKFYDQLLAMQDVLFLATIDANAELKDRAACARAWETLEERKRIMRGKPLPGSHRPEPERKRKAPSTTVVYPAPSAASAPSVVNDGASKPAA